MLLIYSCFTSFTFRKYVLFSSQALWCFRVGSYSKNNNDNFAARARFIELMQSHQWIFSLFPNRTYVSVRRNLPHYDYPEFVRTVSDVSYYSETTVPHHLKRESLTDFLYYLQYFAECELFRPSFPRGTLPPQYGGANAAAAVAAAAASAERANGRAGGLSRTMSTHGANGAGAPGSGAPQPLIPGASRHQSVGGTSSNG